MFMLFSTCLFFPGLPCFPDSASTDNLLFTNVLFDCHTLPLYLSSPPAPLSEPRWALLVILPPTHVTTSQLAHTLPSLCVTLRLPRLLGLPCHEDYFHHGTLTAEARPLMENWFRQLNRPRESCVRDRTADVRCVDCSGSPWELESSLSL